MVPDIHVKLQQLIWRLDPNIFFVMHNLEVSGSDLAGMRGYQDSNEKMVTRWHALVQYFCYMIVSDWLAETVGIKSRRLY